MRSRLERLKSKLEGMTISQKEVYMARAMRVDPFLKKEDFDTNNIKSLQKILTYVHDDCLFNDNLNYYKGKNDNST